MVDCFVIDSMHLLFSGISKRLLEKIMTNQVEPSFKLSATLKQDLIRRSECLKIDIVSEFSRKLRPLDEYEKYKASEYRFFCYMGCQSY